VWEGVIEFWRASGGVSGHGQCGQCGGKGRQCR
jgi:hypothetical protein